MPNPAMPSSFDEDAASRLREKIDALNRQARALIYRDKLKAPLLAQQAQELAQTGIFAEQPYLLGVADSLAVLAELYPWIGKPAEGLDLANQALALYQQLQVRDRQTIPLFARGTAYRVMGDYVPALETFVEMQRLAQETGQRGEEARALRQIGAILDFQGDDERALEYTDRAMAICRELNDEEGMAALYNNYCLFYTNMGMFTPALEAGFRALELFEKTQHVNGQANIHMLLAETYRKLGQIEQGIDHVQKSLRLCNQAGSEGTQGRALMLLGDLHRQQQDFEQATNLYNQAMANFKRADYFAGISSCYEALAQLYKQQGDYRRALEHYEQFHTAREQEINESTKNRVSNLEVLHRTQQAQQEATRQAALREQERQHYERLSRLKDEMLHTTSHDLKGPLAVMKTATYLLRRRLVADPEGRQIVARIDDQIARMQQLISDLLDLARLETGYVLHYQTVAITPLVEKVVRQFELLAQQHNLALRFESNNPTLSVSADPGQLERVVANLLSNAVKYTPTGEVCVSIAAVDQECVVRVTDSGIGIMPEDLPHIFRPFFRSAGQLAEGSGLGLTIARSIVEQHGGRIWAESQVGKGSVFSVAIPLSPSTSAVQNRPDAAA
jgi:signal transduction histidine kinase